jgi:two-component system, LytTR family, sensor kinase
LDQAKEGREWRDILILAAGFWLVQMLLLTAQRAIFAPLDTPFLFIVPRSLASLMGVLISLGFWLVLRRARSWRSMILLIVVLVPVAAIVHAAGNFLLFDLFFGEENRRQATWESYAMASISWGWAYAALASLIAAWIYLSRARAEERRNVVLHDLARTAQLDALRYQIRPHFLFNTLNGVAALIHVGRSIDAEAMVENLSDYMRTTLEFAQAEFVRLADEVGLQKLYLDIEQARFPDRLEAMVEMPEELGSTSVPSLILQPLVENAIKHGVARRRELTRILIAVEERPAGIFIKVANDADMQGEGTPGHHIGLDNVGRRLALLYGEDACFAAGFASPERFEASFTIPRTPAA